MFIFCHLGEIYDRWSTQIPNNNNRDHLVGRLTNWNHSPQPIYQIQPDKPKTICKAALRSFFPQEAGQPPHNTILFLTPILFWQNIHQKSWGENCWQFWLRCLAAAAEAAGIRRRRSVKQATGPYCWWSLTSGHSKQARKLQDVQAEKLTGLQANKLTTW